jgi:glycosyltransferase involved in cell wall biosynthesis
VSEKAAVLHVLCDEAKRRLVRAGCAPEKIRIANLPVSLDEIPDIGVEATGTTRFLIPARFVEKKGHRVLLTAFKRLVDDRLPVSLTCFGYGPAAWLQRSVADLGLARSVRIVDNGQTGEFMAEYVRVLREHDVVLAPSVRSRSGDDEAGPALTLVMAQAAGKPVIVSDFPGSERSVVDGEHGVVVPAGDAGALHGAMAGMVGDVARWERFGRAGRRLVLEEFSDAAYWAHLLDWYQSAAQARS